MTSSKRPRVDRLVNVIALAALLLIITACEPIGTDDSGVVSAPGGRTFHVAANGAPDGDGTVTAPFAGIQDAIDRAAPGDTVWVGPGTYRGKLRSSRSGSRTAPIRLIGTGALLRHDGTSRLLEIRHDHLVIEGFDLADANILVVLQDASFVELRNNTFHDAASECIRLRDRSTDNVIADNKISDCGTSSFDVSRGRKNGEGIYIGTAPEKLDENNRDGPDRSDDNWVHHNTISTPAECVEIKEDAAANLVEHNVCTGGMDPNGAGLVSRGVGTVFRNNRSTGHVGAGLMLTGDRDRDGTGSTLTNNQLTDNDGYGLKITDERAQGNLCGNDLSRNGRAAATPGHDIAGRPC